MEYRIISADCHIDGIWPDSQKGIVEDLGSVSPAMQTVARMAWDFLRE